MRGLNIYEISFNFKSSSLFGGVCKVNFLIVLTVNFLKYVLSGCFFCNSERKKERDDLRRHNFRASFRKTIRILLSYIMDVMSDSYLKILK